MNFLYISLSLLVASVSGTTLISSPTLGPTSTSNLFSMAPTSSPSTSELFSMAPTSSSSTSELLMAPTSSSSTSELFSMAPTSSSSTSELFSQGLDSSEPDDSDLDNDSFQLTDSVSSGSRGIPSVIGIFLVIVSLVFVG